ncbi:MAG: flippase-like domain-containing protein [Anaerolineae bacterium]|nr:flippase-like domain-containing protein [Anaerolineae bacterium]
MKKQGVQIVITLLLSLVALVVALRGIDFAVVGEALRRVHWGWLGVTFVLVVVILFVRAQRWRVLLDNRLSLWDSWGLIVIGYLISGVLPLRAGDPARAVGASVRGPVNVLAALSTVVVERVFDMLLILVLLVATLPLVPGLQTYVAEGQLSETISVNLVLTLSGVLSAGLVLVFVLLALFPARFEALVRRVLAWLHFRNPDRWLGPVQKVLDGFKALGSPATAASVLFWSVLLWALTLGSFYTALRACQAFIPEPSWLASMTAMWASVFGMIFPSQGGLGSFHFAVREALYWGFAVPREAGFAYAVVIHALPYLMGIVLGAVMLAVWGMSIQELIKRND